MRRGAGTALWLVLAVLATACGERAQTASGRKTDTKASEGPGTAFTASGWKPGDATSWEQQMRTRTLNQNEYLRTASH